tara:strand:+ start:363 stop:725 length:363 start_codon:yes stop_codon:yes gene_type:complete
MKKLLLVGILVIGFLTSCVSYKMSDTGIAPGYMNDYCKGSYVATTSIHETPYINQEDGSVTLRKPDRSQMTFYAALEKARADYGDDVTVTNFQWDIKNTLGLFRTKSVIVGMTYDVIRCN